jgi:DNA-binding protein HU-beta
MRRIEADLCIQVSFDHEKDGGRMNKSDLIEVMSEAGDISKTAAGRALDALTDAIAVALKEGETVSVIGFGTFSVKERAARTGRNPQTGATIEIAASKTPSFKAGKALKDAVQ